MSTATLQMDYVPLDRLVARPAEWWRNVLGVVGFEKRPSIDSGHVPVTASMTPSLGSAEKLCEVWRVHYRYCNELLFGSITIEEVPSDERDGPASGADSASAALQRATLTAYREIFDVLQHTQHRHLIRVWNYLPEINRAMDGDERYRHFNSARQSAFRDSGRATIGTVPAASALGSPAGSPISIYFLAARQPPMMIENPRQTSAYHYPPKFGEYSPIFSRACMLSEPAGTSLFVSGTASIVGHETIHAGDVTAQTRETMVNINALVDEANRLAGSTRYSLDALKFKVYVRQPADLAAIERALSMTLGRSAPIVYLQADVCREDLLVEIEATGESRRN